MIKNLFLKELDVNLDLIIPSCLRLQDLIENNFSKLEITYEDNNKNPLGGKYHLHYNTFLYPYPEFNNLFQQIRNYFQTIRDKNKTYYLQSWLNVFKEEGFFDWHSHSNNLDDWHGYFCVNVGATKTLYRFDDGIFCSDITEVQNKNKLLVLGRCGRDKHKTSSEWKEVLPRITIAFDIIEENNLGKLSELINHWLPI